MWRVLTELRVVFFLCWLVPLLPACAEPSGNNREHVLTIGRAIDTGTADPVLLSNVFDATVPRLIYETLLDIEYVDGVPTGNLIGDLAKDWTLDETGTVLTIELRRDHFFDTGDLVTADAVKFTFERAMALNPGAAFALQSLEKIETGGQFEIRFYLKQPFPPFVSFLTSPIFSIVNPKVIAEHDRNDWAAAWLSEHGAGSGPYRIVQWDQGQRIKLVANEYATAPPKFFEEVRIVAIKDATARRIAIAKGEIDIMEGLSVEQIDSMERLDGVRLLNLPSPRLNILNINNARAPLDNVKLRQAIAQAIDYEGILRYTANDQGQLLNGPIPSGVPGHDPVLAMPARDLERAKILMSEIGGPVRQLSLAMVASDPGFNARALAIQSNLADIGLTVGIETISQAALLGRMTNGDFDFLLNRIAVSLPDPWEIMHYAFNSRYIGTGANIEGYANPKVDELLEAANSELDEDKRIAFYQDAQRLIVADVARIYLFASNDLLALRDDIAGFDYSPWSPANYNLQTMYRHLP